MKKASIFSAALLVLAFVLLGWAMSSNTALNSRRGTFSYAYTDRAAGKDYLHTVSVLNGQTVSRIALPADTSGLEAVA